MLHVQVLLGIFVRQARRTRPPGGGAAQRRSPISLLRPRWIRPKGRRRGEIPGSPLEGKLSLEGLEEASLPRASRLGRMPDKGLSLARQAKHKSTTGWPAFTSLL